MIKKTFTNQKKLINTVGSPGTEITSLEPVNTYNRVIAVSRVTKVIFYVRLVISQFFTPNEGIGQGFVVDFRESGAKNPCSPVQVLNIREVTYLSFVHV